MGIYNIITSENDIEFENQLNKSLSEDGMSFADSMQYRIDLSLNIGSSSTKIQKEYIKTKQIISIGVVGTEKHIGATTLAINLCKFLGEYQRSCYIEYNNHNTIHSLTNCKGSLYYEDNGKVEYNGVELYERPEQVSSIQKYDYTFCIYDYGYISELSEEEKNSFLLKDIKFIATSSSRWEFQGIVDSMFLVPDGDISTHYYVINTNIEDREEFKKNFEKKYSEKFYFASNNSNPFKLIAENRDYYKKVFEPYLFNTSIDEKRNGLIQFLKRKRKDI